MTKLGKSAILVAEMVTVLTLLFVQMVCPIAPLCVHLSLELIAQKNGVKSDPRAAILPPWNPGMPVVKVLSLPSDLLLTIDGCAWPHHIASLSTAISGWGSCTRGA